MLNFNVTYLIFFGECNFCHKFRQTFHCFVRRLKRPNEACETLKNYFSPVIVINIVNINIGVNVLKPQHC